jgi:hypothetical protein
MGKTRDACGITGGRDPTTPYTSEVAWFVRGKRAVSPLGNQFLIIMKLIHCLNVLEKLGLPPSP